MIAGVDITGSEIVDKGIVVILVFVLLGEFI